jgi:hypothetical protein
MEGKREGSRRRMEEGERWEMGVLEVGEKDDRWRRGGW